MGGGWPRGRSGLAEWNTVGGERASGRLRAAQEDEGKERKARGCQSSRHLFPNTAEGLCHTGKGKVLFFLCSNRNPKAKEIRFILLTTTFTLVFDHYY